MKNINNLVQKKIEVSEHKTKIYFYGDLKSLKKKIFIKYIGQCFVIFFNTITICQIFTYQVTTVTLKLKTKYYHFFLLLKINKRE